MSSRVAGWAVGVALALIGCSDGAPAELARLPEDTAVDSGVLPPDAGPADAPTTDGASDAPVGDAPVDGGAPRPILGLAPGPGSTALAAQAHLDVLAVGSRAAIIPLTWAALVPDGSSRDAERWAELRALTRLQADAGARVVLALGLTEGALDGRPLALQEAWDAPAVVAAGEALIDDLLGEVGGDLAYLALGLDLDATLARLPRAEGEALGRLVERLAGRARSRLGPPVLGGVGAGIALSAPAALTLLDPLVDGWLVTPRLLDDASRARTPPETLAELDALVAATAHPVLPWDLGTPGAREVGGSPDQQRGYHATVLDWLSRRGDRVPLAVLAHHTDAQEPSCSAWAAGHPEADPTALAAARCSLGLRDSPAWPLVLEALGAQR